MDDIEENSESNFPPQTSVFDQIGASTTRVSVFTRLGNFNQVKNNLTHIPWRSTQQRIGTWPQKSWWWNPKKKQSIKLKEEVKIRSLIPS